MAKIADKIKIWCMFVYGLQEINNFLSCDYILQDTQLKL